MIEIRKPAGVNKNDFYKAMYGISPDALKRVEGRNKGRADPHFVALWDETIAPVPTDTEISSQANVANLSAAKKIKQADIDTKYSDAENLPITIGVFTFDADTKALTEAMSVVVAMQEGYTLPPGFTWIDAGGTAQPTNAAGMKALFKKISVKHYRDAHKYSKLTKQVNSATSLVEVNSVADW